MQLSEQVSSEIIKFLEVLQGSNLDLPASTIGLWQEALAISKEAEPDWDKAKILGERAVTVLKKLRDSNENPGQVDRARGLISILLAAIYSNQENWSAASDYFEQGARYLRNSDDKAFESLAYFGKALAYKKKKMWSEALEALQKALDAIRYDFFYVYKSEPLIYLEERIKGELDLIPVITTEDSEEEQQKSETLKTGSSKSRPIDFISVLRERASTTDLGFTIKGDVLILQFHFDKLISVGDLRYIIFPIIEAIQIIESLERINKTLILLVKPEIGSNVRIENIFFSSLDISLGGFIPETIEALRQWIKDRQFRNDHEKKMAELERAKVQADIRQKDLEIKLLEFDLVKKWIDSFAPLNASPEERSAIANQILPDFQRIARSVDQQKLLIIESGKENETVPFSQVSIEESKKRPSTTAKPEVPGSSFRQPILLPVVNDIAAGLGAVTQNDVKYYLPISDDYRDEANFGVEVVGDSMVGDGISHGDVVLIHQHENVTNGDIAAVVIFTPDTKPLGVLKHYYVAYEKNENLRHWLLVSSNPNSDNLVVTSEGVDEKAIEKIYEAKVRAGKIAPPKFYNKAEIAIAGKYVRVVNKKEMLS